jgi:uncharacterized membrane protein YbaN (DUF454 family)
VTKGHSAVDQTDSVEAQLASGIEIIKLDHIRVQEHFRGRAEVDTMLLPVGLFLGVVPIRSPLRAPTPNVLIFSIFFKAALPWFGERLRGSGWLQDAISWSGASGAPVRTKLRTSILLRSQYNFLRLEVARLRWR